MGILFSPSHIILKNTTENYEFKLSLSMIPLCLLQLTSYNVEKQGTRESIRTEFFKRQ